MNRSPLSRISDKQRAKRGGGYLASTLKSGGSGLRRGKPIASRGKQKPKREARNASYYKSAEWRAKRRAVFARDGYRCTEVWSEYELTGRGSVKPSIRCPNYDETETGVGLIAEEEGYQHRGIPDAIDRVRTRCRWCDRKRTPQERANWMRG